MELNTNLSAFYLCNFSFPSQIDGGNISDTGAVTLSSAINKNPNISAFYVDGEAISGKGVFSLANLAHEHPSLNSINICMICHNNAVKMVANVLQKT